MKSLASLVALVAATLSAHAADSAVTFQNNVFSPPRLVTFDASFGSTLSGTRLRNGVNGNASYVAQLFIVGTGGIEAPVGARANFRAEVVVSGGTWSGGNRTLVGVEPGTPVNLVVKVWDAAFPSYDAAVSAFWSNPAANRSGFGQSAVFSYTQANPVLLPTDTYMTGFSGFSITLPAVPEPSSITLVALGLGGLLWLLRR